MKSKYKETEVGLIPKDWNIKKLKEISTKITDGDHLTPKRTTSGFYLLSARNVKDSYIDLSDVDYVGEEEYHRMKNRCNPEYDDIMISCSGTIGRISRVPKNLKSVLVRSVALIKLMKGDCSSGYVQYSLQSNFGQKQINESVNQGAQPNLFLNQINILSIPLPPTLAEQEAIAEVLSDTDALITSLETTIQKKKLLKQGAMQELLTGKRRLPGFGGKGGMKDTEVGRIPEDWEVRKLGDVLKSNPKYGINAPATEKDDRYFNYLRITDIDENGKINFKDICSVSHPLAKYFILNDNEIVFARTGASVGKSYIHQLKNGTFVYAGFLIKLNIDSNSANAKYIFFLTQAKRYRNWIETNSARSGQPGINGNQIKEFTFPCPTTLAEQEAIANLLTEMDEEIEGLENKLEKTKGIKQGLMQVLLTGKIRLV
ncbi:restriction endonuclease subunit S [Leptospira sp. 96542]|nr:restriction endonuclease subunit S [Leptospira sp. 96542]